MPLYLAYLLGLTSCATRVLTQLELSLRAPTPKILSLTSVLCSDSPTQLHRCRLDMLQDCKLFWMGKDLEPGALLMVQNQNGRWHSGNKVVLETELLAQYWTLQVPSSEEIQRSRLNLPGSDNCFSSVRDPQLLTAAAFRQAGLLV